MNKTWHNSDGLRHMIFEDVSICKMKIKKKLKIHIIHGAAPQLIWLNVF